MHDQVNAEVEGENTAESTPRASIIVQKRRNYKMPDLPETNAQVKTALTALNKVLNTKQESKYEDDCDLYGRLLANKLRQYSEIDRQDIMYEIDGLLLKRRKSNSGHTQPHYVNNNWPSSVQPNHSATSSVSDEALRRPSSAISTYSIPSPTSGQTVATYYEPSSLDTEVNSPPPVFITNLASSAHITQSQQVPQVLHIPHQPAFIPSQQTYNQLRLHSDNPDILSKACLNSQITEDG